MTPRGTWGEDAWWGRVALVAMAYGALVRLLAFLSGRWLWLDESMLALNVMGRSYRELLQPLDYDQAAPPLFLWISRAMGTLGGGEAEALRLLPLTAGLLLLPALWWFGRTALSPAAGAVATALAAGSPTLIYYSAEFKPYGIDATIALVLVGLAWVVAKDPPGGWRWWLLVGTGIVAIALSFPAPLALATAAGILVVRGNAYQWGRRDRLHLVTMCGAWVTAFAVLHAWVVGPAAGNPYLQEFWRADFLSSQTSIQEALYRIGTAVSLPLPIPEGVLPMALVLPAIGVAGCLTAFRFGWRSTVPWLGLVGGVAVVSALGLYPLHGRLLLFAAPLTLTVVAGGLVGTADLLRLGTPLRVPFLAVVVLTPIALGGTFLGGGPGSPYRDTSGLKAMLGRPAGTPVYVLTGAGPMFAYHATDWSAPDQARLAWYARELTWGGRGFRNAREPAVGAGRLSPPGHPTEMVAHSPGTSPEASAMGSTGWADREVAHLLSLGGPEILVYGSYYRERELPHLQRALARCGISWRVLHESFGETLLLVSASGCDR